MLTLCLNDFKGKMDFKQDNEENLSVCVLASGSRGNSVFVSNGSTSVLVDAGLSGIEIERRLNSRGLCPRNLDAIVVSHEHGDHIQGAGVLSRRFHLPLYINFKTFQVAEKRLGKIHDSLLNRFECGTSFMINTLNVRPFSLSHDAADPAGFTINQNGQKIGIATDLGIATSVVKTHLRDCAVLVLEANHDPDMLMNGPYPWSLKQRVRSRVGHLSNEESGTLLEDIKHDGLRHVVLAHLSETNNTPEKALNVVEEAMNHCRTKVTVARQDVCGELLVLDV